MSSPPTPNTSVKAAPLYTSRPKKRENSSLFPLISPLNLFRKKPPPQPSPPVEPYEVAPGIWSTDATARVFGYLGTDDKRAKSRFQGAGPDIQAPSRKAKRKPVPIRGPFGGCEQARYAKWTEQYNTDTTRDEAEASTRFRQEWKPEERTERGSNWPRTRRGKMRTVSRDDQLVERGANPRTGLVSPFVISDNSEESLGGDYIAVDTVGLAGPSPARRTRGEKWKQDSPGWSLVESPLLSPIAQSMSDKLSRTVSVKQLEDRLLVEIPRVNNPDPENMTDEQIKKYQEGVAQAYRRGGGSLAMLDPDTLPPEGPSRPPPKIHKIQRKEVGSGVAHKSSSGDTVVINAKKRTSSPPTPRTDIMKRQKARIITPSNTPKGSSFESCADIISNTMRTTDPFLGRGSRLKCSQTASATQSQSYLSSGQAYQCFQNESKSSLSPTLSDSPPTSPNPGQYLPRLQFPHRSQFANPETSSYRRPMELLPARLRLSGQQRQIVEDVCTTTFTTTSNKGPRQEQRPKLQRQEGNSVVPRVKQKPFPIRCGRETPLNGYRQGAAPINKQAHPSRNPADTLHTSGLVTGRSRAVGLTEKPDRARDLAETKNQRKRSMPADCLTQTPCEDRPKNLESHKHMTQGLSLGSANVARERVQRNQSGDGCTPTYGHRGSECRALPGVRLQYSADDKEQATLSAALPTDGDSKAWLARQWAEVKKEGRRSHLTTLMQEETQVRRQPVLRKAADVKLWLYAAEAWVEPLPKLGSIQRLLHWMISHVMGTMHYASPALTTLRTANATTRDYFRAIKDLILAAVCLLMILNLLLIFLRVLVFVGKVLYWVSHPVETILMVVGWRIVG